MPLRSESAPVCQVGAPMMSESHAMMSSPDTSPMSTCKQTDQDHSCLQQSDALTSHTHSTSRAQQPGTASRPVASAMYPATVSVLPVVVE